jgi:hypothetical protein
MQPKSTRRAVLAGIAAASAALPAVASPAVGNDDAMLALWHRWRPLRDRQIVLQDRRAELQDDIPQEIRNPITGGADYFCHVAGGKVLSWPASRLTSEADIDQITAICPQKWGDPPRPGNFLSETFPPEECERIKDQMRRNLAAGEAKLTAERERRGIPAIEAELERIEDALVPLGGRLTEMRPTGPVGAGVLLDLYFDALDERNVADYPFQMLAAAAAALLPQLPADLAGRLRVVVDASLHGVGGEIVSILAERAKGAVS